LSDEDDQRIDRFHHEAVSSLFERMQTDTAIQDIRVELVSLRLANNASDHQVRKAVAVAMMKHIQKQIDSGVETAADASRKTLTKYRDLVARAESQDTTADRVDFLMESQRDLVQRNDGGRILLFVAKDLYDLEVFGEEVFTEWWEDEKSRGDAGMARVRQSTAQFIEWLENAESASEEEEESK
jgi:translation initiation factor eIF-2B subunit epsilon